MCVRQQTQFERYETRFTELIGITDTFISLLQPHFANKHTLAWCHHGAKPTVVLVDR
ncbi:hypothetical protein K493DRAFT_315260 [Basidiobolus meristosporus CBS 931.73]|uniref:Uncharacterized protein n=1 Tax=Basidiobolus meristosporus CBS 931.73 TaxID=1314790 RepID=A0A1Y1YAC4_9FUNG|nr:hypothetical protein K493DRAFT_315260 [Basidiobolus meristosporus CBS 931.73]|eukprot:ORX94951.1 hypothetical protein K493DRAFT_315260 [Basidiobolus meristosporus CBS 931.73]